MEPAYHQDNKNQSAIISTRIMGIKHVATYGCLMPTAANIAGFECLTEDTRDVMGLLSDVVLRPAMPQRKLDFFRAQVTATKLLLTMPVPLGHI